MTERRESNIPTKSQIFSHLAQLTSVDKHFYHVSTTLFFLSSFLLLSHWAKEKDCIAFKPLCIDCFGNVGSNNHIMNPIHRLYVLSYLLTCIYNYNNSFYIDIFVLMTYVANSLLNPAIYALRIPGF